MALQAAADDQRQQRKHAGRQCCQSTGCEGECQVTEGNGFHGSEGAGQCGLELGRIGFTADTRGFLAALVDDDHRLRTHAQ